MTDEVTDSGPERYLLFRAGGQDFAWPAANVCHLLDKPELFPVADGPSWFAGLLRLQLGAITATVAAIDLRRYLQLDRQLNCEPSSTCAAAIAVNLPHVTVEFQPIAFLVDRFLTTEQIRPRDIRPLRQGRAGPHFRAYSTGSWRGRSRPCYLLSLNRLIRADELDLLRAWVQSQW